MHEAPFIPITFTVGDEDIELIMPPRRLGDVCPHCVGLIRDGSARCFNCNENAESLDGIVQDVVAISLYAKPSRLRDWLTFYKSGDESLADALAVAAVAQIFARFFSENADWLAGLALDYAVVVPSTVRPPPHPLAELLRLAPHSELSFPPVLRRTAEPLDHNAPNPGAFEVASEVGGNRILLIDDVYTSGARAQSAAFRLRAAGAEVVSLCVLGRRYNPDYQTRDLELIRKQRNEQFSWRVDARSR